MNINNAEDLQALIEKLLSIQNFAHVPYSKFPVACLVKPQGINQVFSGCNVENASYGGTICAERVALCKMVSEVKKPILEWLAVMTNSSPPDPPCGICFQFIGEFCKEDLPIHFVNAQGQVQTISFKKGLPYRFSLQQ